MIQVSRIMIQDGRIDCVKFLAPARDDSGLTHRPAAGQDYDDHNDDSTLFRDYHYTSPSRRDPILRHAAALQCRAHTRARLRLWRTKHRR
jgi:hypothetical protein